MWLFLFGAGASTGARHPPPPLGHHLHEYVGRYLREAWDELNILEEPQDGTETDQVRQRLKQHLHSTGSYESLVNELRSNSESDLLPKLNLLMAYALSPPINDDPRVDDAFIEKSDGYDELLKIVGTENVCFVTLNYDCLLKRAICRYISRPLKGEGQCLCKHVAYRLSEGDSGVEVLKVHGSINWIADTTLGNGTLAVNEDIPGVVRIGHNGVNEWNKVDAADSPKGHEDIVVAHYERQKRAQANPDLLERIRSMAIERVTKSHRVSIIGVRLHKESGR